MNKLLTLLSLIVIIKVATASFGVDLSEPASSSDFSCLKQNNFDFAIVRCWTSVGSPDPNCASSVSAAWSGGMTSVDIYFFPCSSCGNPAGQVQQALQYTQSNSVQFGTMWFDIEGPGTYWGSDQGANSQFFATLVQTAQAAGVNVGVYTSDSQWIPIMGGYTGGSSLPLWYAHYDGNPSFSDFSPFGGWSTPSMKQFASPSGSVCSAGIDENWTPQDTSTGTVPTTSGSGSSSGSSSSGSSSSGSSSSGSSSSGSSSSGSSGSSSSGSSGSSGSSSSGSSGSSSSGSGSGSTSSGSSSSGSSGSNSKSLKIRW